mmetsp:Transcript_5851/g.10743  ORF Transcript_5851/g.10743 Transcript_5851/m.10743 type:complete len:95 (-) Transcript_5851:1775-2059(-)
MAYEEVKLSDMKWNLELQAFTYECPCGDLFEITPEELDAGEEIGHCPSCSLYVIVDYTVAEWDAMKAKMFGASDEGEERKEDDFSKGPKGVPVH